MTSRIRMDGVEEPIPKGSPLLSSLENFIAKSLSQMRLELEALGEEPDRDTEQEEHRDWVSKVQAVQTGRWNDIVRFMGKDVCWEPFVKEASTVNFQMRDPRRAEDITWWFIRLMQRSGAATWTLENVPALFQAFRGQFATAEA